MKRKLLCGLLAALTLTCATVKAAPSRVVPVQVDGTVLSQGVNYLQSGVTYVPLRGLLDAFGGWSVWWDSSRKVAAAASGSCLLYTSGGCTCRICIRQPAGDALVRRAGALALCLHGGSGPGGRRPAR